MEQVVANQVVACPRHRSAIGGASRTSPDALTRGPTRTMGAAMYA